MAPKSRPKAQMTLLDFAKTANPLTTPESSSRPSPPRQSTQQKTLKLPRASVPSIFKTTPETPKKRSFTSSAADEAWEIGERIVNGVNLNSRISYEEDSKDVLNDNSDADFEQDEVVHHVARQRPSLKRKHAAYGLRDDRASMTRRSGNKQAKRRTPIKIATQVSMGLLDEENGEDDPDQVRRREVIDQHEVVIVEGEKSEMSGTDSEDEDVSKEIDVAKPSDNKRRISLAGSVVTPTNRFKGNSHGKGSPYQTPEVFSLGLKGPNFDFGSAKAPRKAKFKQKPDIVRSPRRIKLSRKKNSSRYSTGKRATDGSVFERNGERLPCRTASSTRKLVRRLHVSDSESSGADDLPGVNEGEARGGCAELDTNECSEGAPITNPRHQRGHAQQYVERRGQKNVSSEDEHETLAARARRMKSGGRKLFTLPESPVISLVQKAKNSTLPDGNESGYKIVEALQTRSLGPGGSSQGKRRSVFDSDEFVPKLSAIEAGAGERTSPIRTGVPAAVSDGNLKVNTQANAKQLLPPRISRVAAKCNVASDLPHETDSANPRTNNIEPSSKRNCSFGGKRGEQVEVLDRDSESRENEPGVINLSSASEGEDSGECDEEGEESLEEDVENEKVKSPRIVTRSLSQRARRSKSDREPSPAFDSGDITDSSSGLPDDGSVQEVLSQGSVDTPSTPKNEAQTPERRRRVKSSFLNSGRKRISITPESSPSPPSSKKRSRLSKLATRDSEEEENADLVTQPLETQATGRTPDFEQDARMRARRKGNWYHERDITNFSSSSSFGLRGTPASERRRPSRILARRRQGGLRVRSSPPIRKLDLESDSSDLKEDRRVNTEVVFLERNPEAMSLKENGADRLETDQGGASLGVKNVVIDLIGDIEVDPADNAPRDSADREDEIRNSSSAENSGKSEVEDIITVDDDDKPPPFNLIILCKPGESVKEMLERVGEEAIMEKVTEAQNEGREVLGGEELGMTQSFNQGVFGRFSRTVVADQIGQKRKVKNVTEQALRGEYQFNYRGKGAEKRGKRGGGNWYRGKGRRKTTGGGSAQGSSQGTTGRLANVRKRRS